ncbi:hypothetical protein [Dolichospermum sp. UHCC 0259]|uniref:hypothetical protein n=1 Tax=Dolichospermum sp. UHCC 0259 TaxID=2590010 RepID=UPI001446F97A|nr:hypothetical protein [Dolichospermum sp. UHCC 0259]MTJ47436.1 hypothetical protein [Dolichospermum sp. UHCC 0259]
MKATVQQEDLKVLGDILQERLVAEVLDGKDFQIKCAVQNDELMILTQHPAEVTVNTQQVFEVLEQALQWQFSYQSQRVRFFLRISGEKRPYTQHFLDFQIHSVETEQEPEYGFQIHSVETEREPEYGFQIPSIETEQEPEYGFQIPSIDTEQEPEYGFQIPSIETEQEPEYGFQIPSIDTEQEPEYGFQIPSIETEQEPEYDFQIHSVETEQEPEYDFQIPSIDVERETVEIGHERDTFFLNSDLQTPSSPVTETEQEPITDSFFSSSEESFSDYLLPDSNLSADESERMEDLEEDFDPFANIPDKPKKRQLSLSLPPLPIMIGTAVVIAILSGGGAFFLHRGCVISECKELQTAQQFKNQYQQQIKRTRSERDLLTVQQQLDGVVADLQKIPQWSPRYQDSQLLVNSFSEQSTKINQVLKALQMASSAQKTTQTPAKSLDELRNRQKLWKQAITSLEIIKPSNELYGLVKANLPSYQNTLKSVNDQLLKEETWVQKIANATTLAQAATKRQITAKSAPEWQRVESDFQTAISILKIVPIGSLGSEDARKLLAEYQPKIIVARDRATKEQLAATFYQQAMKAASQAKSYGNQNQWQSAVRSWEQAIQTAKQVGQDTFYFNQAKSLIETYTASLKQAQEQFQIYGDLTQTRAELKSTCTNTIRLCTFTIENQQISVRLTPEYDRLFEANNPQIQSHFQSLKDALTAISQNAQLPVFIYNAQGQERYMRQPQ